MKLQIDLRGVLAGGAIFLNLINLILCNLAISAIKKDEDLVKAADRLR
jgi:hypothetical protein